MAIERGANTRGRVAHAMAGADAIEIKATIPDHQIGEALERYKALTGDDKQVSGWIAELRQRVNRAVAPKPEEPAT